MICQSVREISRLLHGFFVFFTHSTNIMKEQSEIANLPKFMSHAKALELPRSTSARLGDVGPTSARCSGLYIVHSFDRLIPSMGFPIPTAVYLISMWYCTCVYVENTFKTLKTRPRRAVLASTPPNDWGVKFSKGRVTAVHVYVYTRTSETVSYGYVILSTFPNRRLIFDVTTLCPRVPPTSQAFICRSSSNSKGGKKSWSLGTFFLYLKKYPTH